MTIREETEAIERQTLSSCATLSANSLGRRLLLTEDPIRPCFQRDRDRILHSKAFRRLKQKTQVFLSPEGDHYRTRLTHTLEVSQIGRTIARALGLNEDLVEAAAMGHDIGHTPFGHAGEYALREICPLGFDHNEQSVRVAERLENDGKGLNLTWEVRDAIRCHSSGCPSAQTFEGRVLRYADKIAYINHDIEDAIRAGVLTEEDIPFDIKYVLGRTKSDRITALVMNIVENSADDITMSPEMQKTYERLISFMFEAVYRNPKAKGEEGKARDLVKYLYTHFTAHVEKMPEEYRRIAEQEGAERAACDYISGMSDRYAVSLCEELLIPKFWQL